MNNNKYFYSKASKKVYPFKLSEMQLIPGTRLYERMIKNSEYMLSLDPDRILYNFRVYAGLDTIGAESYGGWEAPKSEVRGQFIGHYLSACAMMVEYFGKTDGAMADLFRNKTDSIVQGLSECQQAIAQKTGAGYPERFGYLSAFPTLQFDFMEKLQKQGTGIGVPYYVDHKIIAGLISVYENCDNSEALAVAKAMADYFKFRMDALEPEILYKMLNSKRYNTEYFNEIGGMQEVLLKLYEITGQSEYFELAQKFDREWFRSMLVKNDDKLGENMQHANSEIPCVLGMAEYYELTGDNGYRSGVQNFLEWMKNGHTFPTGGVSGASPYPDYGAEFFNYPYLFYDHVNSTPGHKDHQCGESCCSHNLNKLTERALMWTANPAYGDEYEKRFVNAVLAQQNPATGMFIYNLNLKQGAFKEWGDSENTFWCCYCSGLEAYSSLTRGAYFHDNADGLWINNYIASTLSWSDKGLNLRLESDFPNCGFSKITFELSEPQQLDIYLRIPAWATYGTLIKINGYQQEIDKTPASFSKLSRSFKNGDVLEIEFIYRLYAERMPDRPEYVAVKYGPQLLVACTQAEAVFDGSETQLLESLVPNGQPCEFRAKLSTGNITFKPINRVVDETYNGYTKITKPLPEHITDAVSIADASSEGDHELKGENAATGTDHGTAYREAGNNGWFSYRQKVLPNRKMYLKCMYWGSDTGYYSFFGEPVARLFDIQIYDEDLETYRTVATQSLDNESPGNWFDVIYPIPQELTRNKSNVVVRFQAKSFGAGTGAAGRFFGKIQMHYYSEQ